MHALLLHLVVCLVSSVKLLLVSVLTHFMELPYETRPFLKLLYFNRTAGQIYILPVLSS